MPESSILDAFTFLSQGGIIQKFEVGGHNIVLSYPTATTYEDDRVPFFGHTIGRVANRISGAKINDLNSKSYQLTANNGPNTLHGGAQGWGKKLFEGPTPVTRDGHSAILFKYVSKDGEEGFPGTVEMRLWYTPYTENDGSVEKTALKIEYEAELVGDEVDETVVSLTNHSYFNISGGPTLEGTKAKVQTNLYLPMDEHNIPTGEMKAFPGIPVDKDFVLGAQDPDVDHCFIMNPDPASVSLDTRTQPMRKMIELSHPATGLHFETLSTEPAFHFYTGRNLEVPAMDGQSARKPRGGMCIETERYVNAVNEKQWRHQVVLKKGEVYGSATIYRAWLA